MPTKASTYEWRCNLCGLSSPAAQSHHIAHRLANAPADAFKTKVSAGELVLTARAPQLWIIFDLETTGLSWSRDHIIQCSFKLLLHRGDGSSYEPAGELTSFVRTTRYLPAVVRRLTGIADEDVRHAPRFPEVYEQLRARVAAAVETSGAEHCFWVAHNAFKFDCLFWYRAVMQLVPASRRMLTPTDGGDEEPGGLARLCHWSVDTLVIARASAWGRALPRLTLASLYESVAGEPMLRQHRADADVLALEAIFRCEHVQAQRLAHVCSDRLFTDAVRTAIPAEADFMQARTKFQWTPQQRRIITAPLDTHLCVIAGAGCAKTTTALGRIMYLLQQGVTPHHIMLTTFTREASADMVARLERWVGTGVPIVSGTIDSISRGYVRQYDPDLFEQCRDVGEYKHAFLQFLRREGSPARRFVLDEIRYMLVDEYQDINATYFEIIRQFAANGTRVAAVGDDAQNIYTWNGSDIKYILDFPRYFPEQQTHYLTQNFRSTPDILRLANQSILRNVHQLPKEICATKASIGVLPEVRFAYSWDRDADGVLERIRTLLSRGWSADSIAILSRNCTSGGPLYYFEAQLTKHGIPHRLLERGGDGAAQSREGRVALCTIHKAKGLEWDTVFVVGCTDNFFPSNRDDAAQLEEERRLFYVATTRAKYYLHFSYCSQTASRRDSGGTAMSRFLSEVPRSLFTWHGAAPAHFRHCDAAYPRAPPGLRRCVQALDTETIHWLRGQPFFPRACEWDEAMLHRRLETPAWVNEHGLASDYGAWLRVLVARQAEAHAPGCGGLHHAATSRVVARLVVSKPLHATYLRYQLHFDYNLESAAATLGGGGDGGGDGAVLAALGAAFPERSAGEFYPIAEADAASAIALVRLIVVHARQRGVPPHHVYVCTRSSLPAEMWARLERSYAAFRDAARSWRDLLWESFEVSWGEQLDRGRTRLLFRSWDAEQVAEELRPLAECVHAHFVTKHVVGQAPQCNVRLRRDGMSCDALLYLRGTRCLVDIDATATNGAPGVHLLLRMCLMASLMRHAGHAVEKVAVYDPLRGTLARASLAEWGSDSSEALWRWVVARSGEESLRERRGERVRDAEWFRFGAAGSAAPPALEIDTATAEVAMRNRARRGAAAGAAAGAARATTADTTVVIQ